MPAVIFLIVVAVALVIILTVLGSLFHLFGHPIIVILLSSILGALVGLLTLSNSDSTHTTIQQEIAVAGMRLRPEMWMSISLMVMFGAVAIIGGTISQRNIVTLGESKNNQQRRDSAQITGFYAAQSVQNGQAYGVSSAFDVGTKSVSIIANYSDATVEKDRFVVSIKNISRQKSTPSCQPQIAKLSSGKFWCTWNDLMPGYYKATVALNGIIQRSIQFRIKSSNLQKPDPDNDIIYWVAVTTKANTQRPKNDIRLFWGDTSPVGLYAEYKNGAANKDVLSVLLFRNDKEISHCKPWTIRTSAGSYYCNWKGIRKGQYEIGIFVNGTISRKVSFEVRSERSGQLPQNEKTQNPQIKPTDDCIAFAGQTCR